MKNTTEVLHHLVSSPTFKKLQTHLTMLNFIQMLPLSIKGGIAFSYVREKTLFIALKHPCFKQEFYHKLPLINQLLKQYQRQKLSLLEIQMIKYFVQNNVYQKEVATQKEILLSYGELSQGEFTNHAENSEIHAIFERIREAILNNQCN